MERVIRLEERQLKTEIPPFANNKWVALPYKIVVPPKSKSKYEVIIPVLQHPIGALQKIIDAYPDEQEEDIGDDSRVVQLDDSSVVEHQEAVPEKTDFFLIGDDPESVEEIKPHKRDYTSEGLSSEKRGSDSDSHTDDINMKVANDLYSLGRQLKTRNFCEPACRVYMVLAKHFENLNRPVETADALLWASKCTKVPDLAIRFLSVAAQLFKEAK